MSAFQIQNENGSLTPVSHGEFFEALNSGKGYLYYRQGNKHIALVPTPANKEITDFYSRTDNAEKSAKFSENRCQDEKGRPCRFQHDEKGRVVRNDKGHPVRAKCGDCPRNGWTAGKRENCCIHNSCKTKDCACCTKHREYRFPVSLDSLAEGKDGYDKTDETAFYIADPNADVGAALENDELNRAMYAAIERLPSDERDVIKAVYWGKLTQREYAAQNGISKSKANRLYNEALGSLRDILKNFF